MQNKNKELYLSHLIIYDQLYPLGCKISKENPEIYVHNLVPRSDENHRINQVIKVDEKILLENLKKKKSEIKKEDKKNIQVLKMGFKKKNMVINIAMFAMFIASIILFVINFTRMKGDSTENFEEKKNQYLGDDVKPYIMYKAARNFWAKLMSNLIYKFSASSEIQGKLENVWNIGRVTIIKSNGECKVDRPGMEFMEELCAPPYDKKKVKTTDDDIYITTGPFLQYLGNIHKNQHLPKYSTYTRSPIIKEYPLYGFLFDFSIFDTEFADLLTNITNTDEITKIIGINTAVVVVTINVYQPSFNLLTIYRASLHSNIYNTFIPQMDVFKVNFDLANSNTQLINSIIIIILSVLLLIVICVQTVMNVKSTRQIIREQIKSMENKLKKKQEKRELESKAVQKKSGDKDNENATADNNSKMLLKSSITIVNEHNKNKKCKRILQVITVQNISQFCACISYLVTSIVRILVRKEILKFLNSNPNTTKEYYEMTEYAIDIEGIIIIDGITFLLCNLALVGYLMSFSKSINAVVSTVLISVSKSFLLTLSLLIITILMIMSFNYFMLGNLILYLFKDIYNAAFALNFGLSGFSLSSAPLAEGVIETADSLGNTSFILGVGFYLILLNVIIKPHFLGELKKSFKEVKDTKTERNQKKRNEKNSKQKRKDMKLYEELAFEGASTGNESKVKP